MSDTVTNRERQECDGFILICEALAGIVGVAHVLHNSLLCQGAIVAESLQVAILLGVKRLHFGKPDLMLPSRDFPSVPIPQLDS